jgi:hypothetical protein
LPPAGDFQGRFRQVEQSGAGKNKTLLMAHGQNLAGLARQRHQFARLFHGGGDRLFHQHMGAGRQEGTHHLGMGDGGRADADQVHLAQQFAPVGNRGATVMGFRLGAHLGIGIGNGEEFDTFSGVAQSFVFGGVMMTEHAGADHGSFQRSIFRHAATEKQGVKVPNEIRRL